MFCGHFVVSSMGLNERLNVPILAHGPLQSSMNDHFMNKKIGGSIGHNAETKGRHPRGRSQLGSKQNAEKAWNSKEEGKEIILLPPSLGIWNMMIFM
tara:strand:+ start:10026 stop:10316 length:291 start_codon:yes stop_codon:yes gene_type:complete